MVAQVDERILLAAARDGDLDAFEALVRRHQDAVYRVALRILGSEADAEDVVQETFIRAWRSLGRFRGESAFGTWLYRIATRRCLDLVASRRPTDELRDRGVEAPGGVQEDAEQRGRLEAVMRVIAALPPDQRVALVLREFEGLPYEQVAEVLDTTVAAVKGRIHRARLTVLRGTAAWR